MAGQTDTDSGKLTARNHYLGVDDRPILPDRNYRGEMNAIVPEALTS